MSCFLECFALRSEHHFCSGSGEMLSRPFFLDFLFSFGRRITGSREDVRGDVSGNGEVWDSFILGKNTGFISAC